MEHDAVQVARVEQPVAAHGGIPRGNRLERASRQVAREDDVYDVLRAEAALRGDRVDDGDRSFDRELVGDADLLVQLAVEGGDETLPRVDPPAGKEPVLTAVALLVATQQ